MHKSLMLIALVLGCCSPSAFAAEVVYSQAFAACMDNSGGVTMTMIDCIHQETTLQDQRLNKAYKAVMAQLNPERKSQLKQAQRAWIGFRDANCAFYADPDGGSMARVSANDCMLQATASRAQELEGFQQ